MNIFKVLASSRKGFPEEQVSAMLAWLLNPYMEHGLGFSFLKKFLALIVEDDAQSRAKLETILQSVLRLDRQKDEKLDFNMDIEFNVGNAFIDIVLMINNLIFSIENKIYTESASDPDQLRKQYEGLKKSLPKDKVVKIFVIFLVPSSDDTKVETEFNNLDIPSSGENDIKKLIVWKDDVCRIIQEILDEDHASEGTPVNEHIRHTLKAFSSFIKDDFEGYPIPESPSSIWGPNPRTECWKTYDQVKKEGKETDWVGVQHGLSGLLRDYNEEKLKTKKFQYTTQDMQDASARGWLCKDLFLQICDCIMQDNFDGIKWQDLIGSLNAQTIYRIAKATNNTPLFIGIQGGEEALKQMGNSTIRNKSWGVSTEQPDRKKKDWISKDTFIKIVEAKQVFENF